MREKTFEEVLARFRTIAFREQFDCIVAIAEGGIIPAAILNQRLRTELFLLKINFRAEDQVPRYDRPKLLAPIDFDYAGKRVLLVDDRVKTGATLALAREMLADAALLRTFAVNGKADYALYDEACFRFPWIIPN
ncbi:MAG: phosphoribosyltransferase [Prevotellaceae bacterium]|jgi:xanthine phosphoribosyltransferase|nr:phosphoribosyltransferase [Prevotellaceae bacterium]